MSESVESARVENHWWCLDCGSHQWHAHASYDDGDESHSVQCRSLANDSDRCICNDLSEQVAQHTSPSQSRADS